MVNIFAEAAQTATSAIDAATKTGGSFLVNIDWVVIGIFFAIVLGIGIAASRSAGKNTKEFFLGGRGMPWWLLGVSMVACTFSCDTPNLVTGMVRGGGVVSNCHIRRCSAQWGGGGLQGGRALSCTIVDNSSQMNGGAAAGGHSLGTGTVCRTVMQEMP